MCAEAYLAKQYLLVDANVRRIVKGWVTTQHLVDEHTECPPIHRLAVTFRLDNLRGEILWRAAQRPGSILYPLREPEIGDLDVTFVIQEYILRLEVPVDNVQAVQVLDREQNLGGVEPRDVVRELDGLSEVTEEFAAGDVLETHEEVRGRLEAGVEGDDEGMTDGLQYAPFVVDVLHLPESNDL